MDVYRPMRIAVDRADLEQRDKAELVDMLTTHIPLAAAVFSFLDEEERCGGSPQWCDALYELQRAADETLAQMGLGQTEQ